MYVGPHGLKNEGIRVPGGGEILRPFHIDGMTKFLAIETSAVELHYPRKIYPIPPIIGQETA